MAITAAELIARVSVAGADTAAAQLSGVGKSADAAQAHFRTLAGIGAGILVLGLAAAAGASAKLAADFQQGVNRLRTGAGDVTDSFGTLATGILKVSTSSGVLTNQLLPAMYLILSANQRGAQAFDTLKAAAQGSVIEQAKVADVTQALTTLQTNWGIKTYTATQYMNGLIVAVSQGKLTLEQLSTAMSPILPIAAQMGIHFQDVASAMAVQTNAGLNARMAATGLQAVFVNIENPTAKASKAMKEFGVNSIAVAEEMKKSMPEAFKMLMDAALKVGPLGSVPFNRAMADMVGGGTRTAKTIDALTQHMRDWIKDSANIGSGMRSGATDVNGWALALSNTNVVMDKAHAAVEATAITLGLKLLPIINNIVSAVTPLISKFGEWIGTLTASSPVLAILGGVLAGLAVIIGFALTSAVISAAVAFGALTIAGAPLWIIILAVIAAVAGIILVIQHWSQIMQFLGGVLGWIGNLVGTVFSAIGTKVHDTLSTIGSFVGGIFSAIGTTIHNAMLGVANFVFQKLTDIENFFKALPGKILAALATLGSILVAPFLWLYNHNYYVKAFVDSAINIFHQLQSQVGVIFSAIGATIQNALTFIKNTVGSIFSAIGTFIHDRLVWIQQTVGSIFSAIGATIHNLLTGAKNDTGNIFSAMGSVVSARLNDLKNAVGNAFSALGSLMHAKLTDAWNALVSFVSGWPSQAFQWGVNLIQGLINGIGSMLGGVANAAGNIAATVRHFLGFHSPPEEGPAHDADTWMPNLITMLASGLTSGQSKMKAALGQLMTPLSTQLSVSANASLGGLSGLGSLGGLSAPASFSGAALRSSSGQTIVINVQPPDLYVDGQRFTQKQMPHIVNAIRLATGVRW